MKTTTAAASNARTVTIKGRSFNLDTSTGYVACCRAIDRMVDNIERLHAAEINARAKLDRLEERGNHALAETHAALAALDAALKRPAVTTYKRRTRSA
jgi:phytoene/squalene synthetase